MRIAVIGHSLIHIRQQKFYQLLAQQSGWDVALFSPGEWGEQRTKSLDEENFHIRTLRHFGGEDQYRFHFVGLRDALEEGKFDLVYVNQEPASMVALDVAKWSKDTGVGTKTAIFTWENVPEHITHLAQIVLGDYDITICGNDDAERLAASYSERTVILPQVGVDTDHFQARPVERNIPVAYIGRQVPEKGIDKLQLAWPTVRVLSWQPYLQLPWWISQCQVVVCFSQDTPYWKEQAMPYVAMEAICCGSLAVVSDAGSIPFWHLRFAGRNPAVEIVRQDSVADLRHVLEHWTSHVGGADYAVAQGRQWVEENLSSRVIAKRLVEALSDV